jgi:hypothetical protein
VHFKHLGYGPGGEKVMESEIRDMLGLEPFEGINVTEDAITGSR